MARLEGSGYECSPGKCLKLQTLKYDSEISSSIIILIQIYEGKQVRGRIRLSLPPPPPYYVNPLSAGKNVSKYMHNNNYYDHSRFSLMWMGL